MPEDTDATVFLNAYKLAELIYEDAISVGPMQ